MGLKKCILKIIFLLILPIFLVSCGSFNLFKKTAEPVDQIEPNSEKITALESELTSIRNDQSQLESQLIDKNDHIQKT